MEPNLEPQNPLPQLPTQTFTPNHHKFIYIFFGVFILLTLAGLFVFGYKINTQERFSNKIDDHLTQDKIYLFPDFNWAERTLNDKDGFKVTYKNIRNSDKEEYKRGEYQPKGKIYTTVVKLENYKELGFSDFYHDVFEKYGWNDGGVIELPTYKISVTPPLADSPLGGLWGAIKIEGDKARLIGLSSHYTKYIDGSAGAGPVDIDCPCEIKFEVFISEEFNLSDLNFDNKDVSTWKTYRNEEYGFEFKYPTGFSTSSYMYGTILKSEGRGEMYVGIRDNKFDPNNIIGNYGPVKNATQVMVGDKFGYKYVNGDVCDHETIDTDLENKTLQISFTGCIDEGEVPFKSEEIDQILSNFKFSK